MLKSIRTCFMFSIVLFAVSCAAEQPAVESIGAKTKFDPTVFSTTQNDLDVIENWEAGTTRGNEIWKIRRISN